MNQNNKILSYVTCRKQANCLPLIPIHWALHVFFFSRYFFHVIPIHWAFHVFFLRYFFHVIPIHWASHVFFLRYFFHVIPIHWAFHVFPGSEVIEEDCPHRRANREHIFLEAQRPHAAPVDSCANLQQKIAIVINSEHRRKQNHKLI